MRRFSRLTVEDLAAVERFDTPLQGGWSSDAIRLALEGTYDDSYKLELRGEVLAFCIGRRVLEETELHRIAVAPAHRGSGLATALLLQAMNRWEQAGSTTTFLEVAVDNTPARALYEGVGFVRVGRRLAYYQRPGGSVDALLMRRDRRPT